MNFYKNFLKYIPNFIWNVEIYSHLNSFYHIQKLSIYFSDIFKIKRKREQYTAKEKFKMLISVLNSILKIRMHSMPMNSTLMRGIEDVID